MEVNRCFVSIDLSCRVINEIKRIQSLLKKRNIFLGKFTEPENLHLTLKFLGEINDSRAGELVVSEKHRVYLMI